MSRPITDTEAHVLGCVRELYRTHRSPRATDAEHMRAAESFRHAVDLLGAEDASGLTPQESDAERAFVVRWAALADVARTAAIPPDLSAREALRAFADMMDECGRMRYPTYDAILVEHRGDPVVAETVARFRPRPAPKPTPGVRPKGRS